MWGFSRQKGPCGKKCGKNVSARLHGGPPLIVWRRGGPPPATSVRCARCTVVRESAICGGANCLSRRQLQVHAFSRRSTVRPERAVTAEQRTRVRPIAVTKPQAAAALSMSIDSFERYVQPDLRVIRRGRLRLFTVAELERWANENAQRTLP